MTSFSSLLLFFSFLSSGHVFAAIAAVAPLANHGAPEAPGVLICF